MFELSQIIDIIVHLDKYLIDIVQNYGGLTYGFLFLIIFCETGLVAAPFLPGDSLLFVAGALAALGTLNIWALFGLLLAAAFLGDTVNYWIGHFFGPLIFRKERGFFFKKEYLERTNQFFAKHGRFTIILARFVPIMRTFAPFVAGIGRMNYWKFLIYNLVGGFIWVFLFLGSGYFFGNIPFVKQNLSWFILLVILISLMPAVLKIVLRKKNKAD